MSSHKNRTHGAVIVCSGKVTPKEQGKPENYTGKTQTQNKVMTIA